MAETTWPAYAAAAVGMLFWVGLGLLTTDYLKKKGVTKAQAIALAIILGPSLLWLGASVAQLIDKSRKGTD